MTVPMTAAGHGRSNHLSAQRRYGRLGLRNRITLAVTAAALIVSVGVALATISVGRRTLVDTRESSIERQAIFNATTLSGQLNSTETLGLQTLLGSLPDTGSPSIILGADPSGEPSASVSLNPKYGSDLLPTSLIETVSVNRENAIMRFRSKGEPLVAVGVAIPDSEASYFQIHSLSDIDSALSTMRLGTITVTLVATFIAMILGYWASGYALQPLRRIGDAAKEVALGRMDTRINYTDYDDDAELAPLVANFNDMLSALQDRIDRDARFASDVSHELRSPLTTLTASVEVLQNSKDALPERSQKALDLLTVDLTRFSQLVEDLLEISRFDAGAVRLDLDTVPLMPTLTKVVKIAAGRPIPVVSDPNTEDLVVACDKRRLIRVVTNFIDNADKYAGGATAVTLTTGRAPDPETGSRGTFQIAVLDEGPGVPIELRSKIFDRFNRGGQGGSRGIDMGVGLGLALAAEHARLQGGRVWVEDRQDGVAGSRFVIELPVIEPIDPDETESLIATAGGDWSQVTGQVPAVTVGNPGDGSR